MSCDPVFVGTTTKEGEGVLICKEFNPRSAGESIPHLERPSKYMLHLRLHDTGLTFCKPF